MESIKKILESARTIAVVGISEKRDRPSYYVSEYMKTQGYKIIPVNPGLTQVLGEEVVPSLTDCPEHIDIVNIFRRPEAVPEIVDEAIAVKAKVIWMQLGIEHAEAARKAEAAGLKVVMNKCIMAEHRRIFGDPA